MTQHILKVSRLEGLTDGIFAIAMTILVLDLHFPIGINPADLASVITSVVLFKLFVYAASFIILGTLWVAMNFQTGLLDRVNRPYFWAHVFYLMAVCVVPFSASLITLYPNSPASIYFYAGNLLCASLGQVIISQCAHIFGLNREAYNSAIRLAILRRIFVAPCFYVVSILLAQRDTHVAFIMLIIPTIIYMVPGRVDKFD